MSERSYDPLLMRQLRKVGLSGPDQAPTVEQFQDLLDRIEATYVKAAEDRELLTRSLDLSSGEMSELHRQLETQRDKMEQVVIAVSDALSAFGEIARDHQGVQDAREITGLVHVAKRRFASRISELLGSEPAPGGWQEGPSSSTHTVHAIRRSFLGLADQIAELLSQTAQAASIRKELEVARAVQQMLVPAEDEMQLGGVWLAALFEPAAECGGDWWTAHPLDDGRVLVVIGDVTGHGISSAILTGVARAACDLARTASSGRDLNPGRLLAVMNRAIYEAGRQRFMMTCAAGVLDPVRGVLDLANAGHGFPYLVRDHAVKALVARGSPLGSAIKADYSPIQVEIAPGDLLVWYTDGVVECEDASGEPFTERRFRTRCGELARYGPRAMRDLLVEELRAFQAGRPAADDVTFVLSQIEVPVRP